MIQAKIAHWKKDRVGEIADILNSDGVIGIVDIGGVPAKNMLDMRKDLRQSMTITMAKKTLMKLAWEKSGRSSSELETLLEGAIQPAIVQTDQMNAFQLYSELAKTKQGRAAKAGEVFPEDVTVPAGPTEFGPGPIVGEFNAVGIPAKIDKGKVAIQKSTTFSKGDEISADLGIMLAKLGINPIEIGIILTGAIEDGILFNAESLDLDLEGFESDIITATSGAFNLACNIRWFTPITMPTLVSKASGEAISVAVEAGISNDETIPLFISRANARALALAGQLDSSALDDELAAALGAAASAATSAVAATSDAAEPAEETPAEVEEEEEEAEFGGLGDLFG
tara:strand:+ start:33468 stop:34487 length:1020 start_codon:yes stop_codon:yes gene_type:complete